MTSLVGKLLGYALLMKRFRLRYDVKVGHIQMINNEYLQLKLVFKYISNIYDIGDIDKWEVHDPCPEYNPEILEKYKYFIIVHLSFNIYIEWTEVLVDNGIQCYKPLICLKHYIMKMEVMIAKTYFQEK